MSFAIKNHITMILSWTDLEVTVRLRIKLMHNAFKSPNQLSPSIHTQNSIVTTRTDFYTVIMKLDPLWYHIPKKKNVDTKCISLLLLTHNMKALALVTKQRKKMAQNACTRRFEEQHWYKKTMCAIEA